MTDRELLELAAKAAGYPFDDGRFEDAAKPGAWWGWSYIESSGEPPNDSAWTELWNPLTDDGDALRLAVKLKLDIGFPNDDCVWAFARRTDVCRENPNPDPYAATRRAIVRAAAEIGKGMK